MLVAYAVCFDLLPCNFCLINDMHVFFPCSNSMEEEINHLTGQSRFMNIGGYLL